MVLQQMAKLPDTHNHKISTIEIRHLCDMTQRMWIIDYRRFRTTYLSHLGFLTLEEGAERLSRMSVRHYHHTLRNIADEGRSQLLQGGSLELRSVTVISTNTEQKASYIKYAAAHLATSYQSAKI